ncbi:ATP-binding cassette domain-containing protein [Psychrosphaera sp.]|nr:ATP-binding cassette domain-containing protein [Psychrosphaera sp.]
MLKVNLLEKHYQSVTAVNGLSFEVNPGEIFALLGPNGAGKSSLVKMLVGFTQPDSGSILLTDNSESYRSIPSHLLGYLPEDRGLYPEKTVKQNLEFFATLHGVEKGDFEERCAYWLDKFSLTTRIDEQLKALSKGNQQKVQLISAVLHQPKWVILDEPFSGLDPINQELVVQFLAELKQQGMTVILSAHQMAMVEKLADRVLLLNQGTAVIYGDLEDILLAKQAAVIHVRYTPEQPLGSLDKIKSKYTVEAIKANQLLVTLHNHQTLNELLPLLSEIGNVVELKNQSQTLHTIYLNAVANHNSESDDNVSLDEGQS